MSHKEERIRFTQDAWQQFRPLFPIGASVEFDNHGRHRIGQVDTIGEGPRGAFLTIRHPEGVFKSYSLAKVTDLRVSSRNTRGYAESTTRTGSESAHAEVNPLATVDA